MHKKLLILTLSFLSVSSIFAEAKLAEIFADGMVIQQEKKIPIWGTADAGEKVSITLDKENSTTVADKSGNWIVYLNARKASFTPLKLAIVASGNSVVIKDILIGEVWFACGQSNMWFPLKSCGKDGKNMAKNSDWSGIHFYHRKRMLHPKEVYKGENLRRSKEQDIYSGSWLPVSTKNAGSLSAVACYFAHKLRQKLNVPIGILSTSVGGTPTESFISLETLNKNKRIAKMVAEWPYSKELHPSIKQKSLVCFSKVLPKGKKLKFGEFEYHHPWEPAIIFNTGVKPLMPAQIRGAIWYQGESNGDNPGFHNLLFSMLVQDWRDNWNIGKFPVYYVQLPSMNRPKWPEFRDGQRKMVSVEKRMGQVVTMDVGMKRNVHPTNKRPVGERLAFLALNNEYKAGEEWIASAGALVDSITKKGDVITITFKYAKSLKTTKGGAVNGFEIATANGKFIKANATISGNTIVIKSSKAIKTVRYGWAPFPQPALNLIDEHEFPVSPFKESVK